MGQTPHSMTIRPLRGEDWHDCYELWRCSSVLWGTLGLPSLSEDAVREKVQNPPSNMHRFGVVMEDKVVGVATLSTGRGRRSHVGYLGVSVRDDYQRRGIGTALMTVLMDLADNWLGLRRLELEVLVDNEAALSLYRRFGFSCEGRRSQDVFRGGQYVDTFIMGRLGKTEE